MRATALCKDLSGYRELLLSHYYSSAFWSLTLTFIIFLKTALDNIFWNFITGKNVWHAMTTIQTSSPVKIHFKYLK